MIYIVTAGNVTTDPGVVGKSNSVKRAKTIGRKAVDEMLGGMGSYTVKNSNREPIVREEKSRRTGGKWVGRL